MCACVLVDWGVRAAACGTSTSLRRISDCCWCWSCCCQTQVNTHAGWLSTNCNNQADYYASYLQQHNMPGGQKPPMQQQQASSSNGSGSQAAPPATAASSSGSGSSSGTLVPAATSSKSLAAVGEFKVEAARALLEAEIKDAFLGTAGAAAGEAVFGQTLTVYS